MELKELRIGNQVYNQRNQIVEIDVSRLSLLERGICKYTPILLTEEHLIELGFEKEIGHDDNIIYRKEWVEIDECFQLIWYEYTEIKYLHDIQNLYYAMTKQELTISK